MYTSLSFDQGQKPKIHIHLTDLGRNLERNRNSYYPSLEIYKNNLYTYLYNIPKS